MQWKRQCVSSEPKLKGSWVLPFSFMKPDNDKPEKAQWRLLEDERPPVISERTKAFYLSQLQIKPAAHQLTTDM